MADPNIHCLFCEPGTVALPAGSEQRCSRLSDKRKRSAKLEIQRSGKPSPIKNRGSGKVAEAPLLRPGTGIGGDDGMVVLPINKGHAASNCIDKRANVTFADKISGSTKRTQNDSRDEAGIGEMDRAKTPEARRPPTQACGNSGDCKRNPTHAKRPSHSQQLLNVSSGEKVSVRCDERDIVRPLLPAWHRKIVDNATMTVAAPSSVEQRSVQHAAQREQPKLKGMDKPSVLPNNEKSIQTDFPQVVASGSAHVLCPQRDQKCSNKSTESGTQTNSGFYKGSIGQVCRQSRSGNWGVQDNILGWIAVVLTKRQEEAVLKMHRRSTGDGVSALACQDKSVRQSGKAVHGRPQRSRPSHDISEDTPIQRPTGQIHQVSREKVVQPEEVWGETVGKRKKRKTEGPRRAQVMVLDVRPCSAVIRSQPLGHALLPGTSKTVPRSSVQNAREVAKPAAPVEQTSGQQVRNEERVKIRKNRKRNVGRRDDGTGELPDGGHSTGGVSAPTKDNARTDAVLRRRGRPHSACREASTQTCERDTPQVLGDVRPQGKSRRDKRDSRADRVLPIKDNRAQPGCSGVHTKPKENTGHSAKLELVRTKPPKISRDCMGNESHPAPRTTGVWPAVSQIVKRKPISFNQVGIEFDWFVPPLNTRRKRGNQVD
nr:hypothetical protein [Tolivirales sp.]